MQPRDIAERVMALTGLAENGDELAQQSLQVYAEDLARAVPTALELVDQYTRQYLDARVWIIVESSGDFEGDTATALAAVNADRVRVGLEPLPWPERIMREADEY